MGLGDAKIAATIGLVLGWMSWQALFTGTFDDGHEKLPAGGQMSARWRT